jgi:hypothetical protein
MSLLREYIRKLIIEWEPANDENLMLDQEGMEKSDRENVSQYLKSLGLLESSVLSIIPVDHFEFPVVPPPPLGSLECIEDLAYVILQYYNREVPDDLQESADTDMDGLFEKLLDYKGVTYNTNYYSQLRLDLIPLISALKQLYKRHRPAATAAALGIDFKGDNLETAQSFSYPSGHAIQAYVVALLLGDQFPDYADDLLQVAEVVSQSRIDRGVHFLSDIEFGKEIAYLIAEEILNSSS